MTLLDLGDEPTRDADAPTVGETPTVGQCVCGRKIWDPVSLHHGIGPDCRRKLGITPRRPVRITGVPSGWDCDGQGDLLEETG